MRFNAGETIFKWPAPLDKMPEKEVARIEEKVLPSVSTVHCFMWFLFLVIFLSIRCSFAYCHSKRVVSTIHL